MPIVSEIDPDNPHEIVLPLLVPSGKQGNDLNNAIPELQAYLKDRHPEVQQVQVRYQNPPPNVMLVLTQLELWILVQFLDPITRKMAGRVADDAYNWLKKRFKVKKKKRHRRKRKRKPRG